MNIKKKYDALIEQIETLASNQYETAVEITETLSKSTGLSIRDLNTVFQYLCDNSLLLYVKERKMNAAYKYLIDSTHLDIRTAVEISGYDNQSSFTKKFSAFYCMSPKEAYKKKDSSLIFLPKTWDVISMDSDCSNTEKAEDMNVISTKFGIPLEFYDKVTEIQNLESLYQLPQLYTALAEELWQQEGMTLNDAFRYADSLHDWYEDISDGDCDEETDTQTDISDPMESLREIALDKYNRFIFFDCNLSIDAGFQLEYETRLSQSELMKEEPDLLKHYLYWTTDAEVDYYYFKTAYEYYQSQVTDEYTDEDLDKYLSVICCGVPKEEAFPEIVPSNLKDYDKYDCIIPDPDFFDPTHLLGFDDEEDAWDDSRIDTDLTYDPDNPYYD